MLKKLLTALAVLALLTGFTAACGGDDDDSSSASSDDTEATDDTDDTAAADGAVASDLGPAANEFCVEFLDNTGGDVPIEDVQATLDRATAAQEEIADPEVVAALQQLIDLGGAVMANDDGDGIITQEETQAAVAASPEAPAALETLQTYCSA